MPFTSLFPLSRGDLVAVVGGGGKTGLLEALEAELTAAGRPSLASVTTRLGRWQLPELARVEAASFEEASEAVRRAASGQRILLSGPPRAEGEAHLGLRALPLEWFEPLRAQADLIWLVEADGSAGRPVKAHKADEPVLPPRPYKLVMVLGLSALAIPWTEAIHRPEIFREFQPLPETARALSPGEMAGFARKAWPPLAPDLVFLNQLDAVPKELEPKVLELSALLAAEGFRVVAGSLADRTYSELA
jgi:probable selenium-dependent hydroxylase accessory protein YqeC